MAGRGRPPKNKSTDISSTEEKARAEGKTYGQYMAEQQRQEVKIEKDDTIERHKTAVKPKLLPMPERTKRACILTLTEISEDISNHQKCIDNEQKAIDGHIGCIRAHEQAIRELETELAEQKSFLKQFEV